MDFIIATAAYGRQPTATDWLSGKDFKVHSGPYFSIRDVDTLKADGIKQVQFIDRHGFLAFTVYTDKPNSVYK